MIKAFVFIIFFAISAFTLTTELNAQSSEEIELSQCSVEAPMTPLLIQFTYVDWQSNRYIYTASYVHRYSITREVLIIRYDRYGNVVLRETVKRQTQTSENFLGTRRYGSYGNSEDQRINEVRNIATPEFRFLYANSVGLRNQCQD